METVEVCVPETFDNVYLGYNEMQKEQGLNLAKYKGKTVTRYTYKVENYPDYEGTVYLSLLVYKNKYTGWQEKRVCFSNLCRQPQDN